MIAKLIRMAREKAGFAALRDDVYALTRYVIDADPWAMALLDREAVRSLSEYLLNAQEHGVEPGEKAGHIGARNLLTDNLREQQAEMLAVASAAPRVEYPVVHIILSWRADEHPGVAQLEDTVDTVLATTGLSACQVLYAEHTNTPNPHLHLAAVRVDPATMQAAGSEWLIEDLHQAIAILEERHGWAAEPNALYYARDGAVFDASAPRYVDGPHREKLLDPTSEVMIRDAAGRFVTNRDWKGVPFDVSRRRGDILYAHAEATSWTEFHQLLDAHRLAYRKKGSGARIHIGEVSAKASKVAPKLALTKMESDWGPFIPHPRDRIPGFDEYRIAHAAQLKRLREDRAVVQAALDAWAAGQLVSVAVARNRHVDQAIRAERDAAQKELNTAFAAAIKTCTDARHTKVETWRAAGSPTEPPPVMSPALLLPPGPSAELPWSSPMGLRAEHDDWVTRYYDDADRLVFTDHRTVIVVHRSSDTDALDAALRMAAERWGRVQVSGSEGFQQRCAARAAALGIELVDNTGKPLVAARAVAPAPLLPPVAVVAPVRPDHRADPVRQAAIDDVIAHLNLMEVIPLRRRPTADGSARLEIVVDVDRFDPKPELNTASLFDEEPRIQAILEHRRVALLAEVGHHLLQFDVHIDKKAIVGSLRGPRARAAFLAFDDADFQSMLDRTREERVERERQAGRRDRDRRQAIQAALDRLAKRVPTVGPSPPDVVCRRLVDGDLWATRIEHGVRIVPITAMARDEVEQWRKQAGADRVLAMLADALASIEPPGKPAVVPEIILNRRASAAAAPEAVRTRDTGRGR